LFANNETSWVELTDQPTLDVVIATFLKQLKDRSKPPTKESMPTVSVSRDLLFEQLGRSYTDEQFDELCFEFGVELDEITSERREAVKGSSRLSAKQLDALSDDTLYKIDVPANRYDLLCIEGLSRALRVFSGDLDAPVYKLSLQQPEVVMRVHKTNVDAVRPYVVCAILRDVTFTQSRYESFIDLQDQLHRNLCRQRTLVAIGTHDLDTLQGPFLYDAKPPSEIEFVPLTPDDRGPIRSDALLELYETDPSCKHLKPYVPIIKDSPTYPVIYDSNSTVLSLPPLINGSHSKIALHTRNVFVECTATDLTKANIVLDTVVCMFSEYCATPFVIEPVRVEYVVDDNRVVHTDVTPTLSCRRERATVAFCNSLIGIQLEAQKMKELCNKVQLGPAALLENDTILEVTVPPTRSDILHPVDIAEDVGIAYGYNNIVKRVPQTCTVGSEFPLNQYGDLLRDEISRAGYTEVLTHGLCSIRDNFTALRRPVTPAVQLSNPANIEYQVVRTSLLPGLLKTLQHNKSASFTSGFKLFEISDVVLPDPDYEFTQSRIGARNARRLCAVYAGPTSGFEVIHGLVDRVMTLSEIAPEPTYVANSAKSDEEAYRVSREGWEYTIAPVGEQDDDAGTYFPGRAASILLSRPGMPPKARVGSFGILHPEVLSNFDILYPASCVELDLEALM
jgi:phenylalanyl-tRNA synthetase beta chain